MSAATNVEVEPEGLENFCRGCLIQYGETNELIQYTEKARRQFIYATGLQVKRNDAFTFQLCKDCYINIKMTCKFKKQCRTSDKRYKNYLAMKEAGETADFRSFLKKTDETFRFPFMNGYSTPMHQKSKDDDNESTTTSIRNFMTDILKEEQIPDTEVNIIREEIEEEADILDDSLDSQWLQEDMSIDTDFNLDFSFSPFATPRSVVNSERIINQSPRKNKENVQVPTSFSPFATPRSVVKDNGYSTTKKHKQHVYAPISFSPFATPSPAIKAEPHSPKGQDEPEVYVPSSDTVQIQAKVEDIVPDPMASDTIHRIVPDPLAPDAIDRNLEKALKDDAQEFALDDLLISPANPQVATPTITDILFGGKALKCEDVSQFSLAPKIGQTIETYEDVKGEILEDMFKGAKMNFYGSADITVESLDGPTPTDTPQLKSREAKKATTGVDLPTSIEEDAQRFFCLACDLYMQDYDTTVEHYRAVHDVDPKGKEMPRKEVFLPTVDVNLPPCKDKFQPRIELVYETTSSPTENQPSIEEDAQRFFCLACDLRMENFQRTLEHYRAVHKVALRQNTIRVCDQCGKEFRDLGNFWRHVKAHQKPKDQGTYTCDICKCTFSAKSKIRIHMRTHMTKQIGTKKAPVDVNYATKKKLECKICGARSTDHSNLRAHMRRHEKKYTEFCPECNKGFIRKLDLKLHMRKHGVSEKLFDCTQCDKKYDRRDALLTHIRVQHTGERPFECEFCHAKFVRGNLLTQHLRKSQTCKKIRENGGITDTNRIFECEHCHAKFKYPCHLTMHVQKSNKCMMIRAGIVERKKRKYRRKKISTE